MPAPVFTVRVLFTIESAVQRCASVRSAALAAPRLRRAALAALRNAAQVPRSVARHLRSIALLCWQFVYAKRMQTRMWANAQPDGRPAEQRWRPLFNAAKIS